MNKKIEVDEPKTRKLTGWEGWNTIMMALFRATAGSDEGYEIALNWCRKNKYKHVGVKSEKYVHYTWYVRYRRSPPKLVGAGTLFTIAETYSPGWQKIWDQEHIEKIVETKVEEAIKTGKYIIKRDKSTNKNLRELEEYLLANKVPLYVFGKTLVRPIVSTVEAMQGRMTKVAELFDVTAQHLKVKALDHILFEKYEGRTKKWLPTGPDMELFNDLMSKVGEWKFQVIIGIISTPTLRHDGSILSAPGYDPETRLLMIDPPELPAMPDKLSRDDAFAAIELLEDLISEFAFVDDVAKSVALAALVTPVVRGAIGVAPMFVNKAPTPASGKSYLFDIVAAIAIGQRMPVIAAGRKEEETEKRLGASLICGRPLINIDNVDGELGGDALCQFLERPSVIVRILGKSEDRTIDPRRATFFGTGNNLTLVGDITRRALICSLDTNEEQPEQLQYKKDPVQMVLSDRGKYIAACLTICRAYIQAGYPGKVKKLASYESWSDLVRSALIWLGREDPVKSMDIARAEDPRLIDLQDIMTQWSLVIGTGESSAVTLNKVLELCKEDGDSGYDKFDKKYPELYDAICRVASSYGRPPDPKRFGQWATKFKGRLFNGMKLVNKLGHGKVAQWWLQHGDDPMKDSPGLRHADNVVNVKFNERDNKKKD
jgi:hypothetical protein